MVERIPLHEQSDLRSCKQERCSFFGTEGCKSCEECTAPAHLVKKDCSVCLACENIEDTLRWDDGGRALKEKEKVRAMVQSVIDELENTVSEEKVREKIVVEVGR